MVVTGITVVSEKMRPPEIWGPKLKSIKIMPEGGPKLKDRFKWHFVIVLLTPRV
jgi:hypothetical protein